MEREKKETNCYLIVFYYFANNAHKIKLYYFNDENNV